MSATEFGFCPNLLGLIGYKLVFWEGVHVCDPALIPAGFVAHSVLSSGLAARLGGFRGLDIVNIALTTSSRGGPGIALANVAYDAGASLVITAVVIPDGECLVAVCPLERLATSLLKS